MLVELAWFTAGLMLLIAGGDLLVRGASQIAARFGVSRLVVGLTVVALGTSAPELAVSVQAGLSNKPDIAVGNVVGSNIFNVLFVLGIAALIAPLTVNRQLVRSEVPIMIGASLLMLVLALDGVVSTFEGLLLAALLAAYVFFTVRASRREIAAAVGAPALEAAAAGGGLATNLPLQLGAIVLGLGLLVLGAGWLVGSAIAVARALGVSDLVIALTIVAVGTSMPEVVTSIIATIKGERDIAVGNVVGSSIFNILGILGIASIVTPGGLLVAPAVLNFDIPVMIAAAVACLPIFFTAHLIARWEGLLFLGYYVAYTTYLIMMAVEHEALPAYSAVMLGFVLPITAITLLVLGARALRVRR